MSNADNPIVFPSDEFDQTGVRLTESESLDDVWEIGGFAFAFIQDARFALEPASIKGGRSIVDKQGRKLVRVSPIDGHVIESALDSDRQTTLRG